MGDEDDYDEEDEVQVSIKFHNPLQAPLSTYLQNGSMTALLLGNNVSWPSFSSVEPLADFRPSS